MLSFMSCASSPQKAAVNYAKSVNFNFDSGIDTDSLCAIVCKKNAFILAIDGFYYDKKAVLPGTHHLVFFYISGSQRSDYVNLVFVFEKGKHYYLDYEILKGNEIQFTIKELNDPNLFQEAQEILDIVKSGLEKQKSYLAFSKANPAHLEGLWDFHGFNIAFDKDRYDFTVNTFAENYTSDGRYFFDEKTIVLFVRKDSRADYQGLKKIWYYEFKNDTLYITGEGLGDNFLGVGRYAFKRK